MTDQTPYRAFCAQAPDLPIFHHDWYLDAVCGGPAHWDAVLVEKGGKIAGVWPFFVKKQWGFRYVAMPVLCRLLGPYLLPEYRGSRHEPALIEELLHALPPLAAFEQDCHYHFTNWLPAYWQGYRQTTRYSYRVDLSDREHMWKNLDPDYRNNKIPKAKTRVHIRRDLPLSAFWRVHLLTFERQGINPAVDEAFLLHLDEALAGRNQRTIWGAIDLDTGKVHAVAYVLYDGRSAYYLMAGEDPDLRQSGAGILLAWEAMTDAASRPGLEYFDFLGSMIKPIERVRRNLGGAPTPYFRLQKEESPFFRLAKCLFRRR